MQPCFGCPAPYFTKFYHVRVALAVAAKTLHEFPTQTSHECLECIAALDVSTANGQVC